MDSAIFPEVNTVTQEMFVAVNWEAQYSGSMSIGFVEWSII